MLSFIEDAIHMPNPLMILSADELVRHGHINDANRVFYHGAAGGLVVPYERYIEMLRINENYGYTGMKAVWTYIDLMRRRGHMLSVLEYNHILKGLVRCLTAIYCTLP